MTLCKLYTYFCPISPLWIIKTAFRDAVDIPHMRVSKVICASSNVFGPFRTIGNGMWKTNSRHWERYRGSETAKFATMGDCADVNADSWRDELHRTLYFFLIPPSIGRIPICPRTCCGPRHCQHVSEPIRRALVFGALWQHHGLHDYFFVQSRDRRGTMRASCNISIK